MKAISSVEVVDGVLCSVLLTVILCSSSVSTDLPSFVFLKTFHSNSLPVKFFFCFRCDVDRQ